MFRSGSHVPQDRLDEEEAPMRRLPQHLDIASHDGPLHPRLEVLRQLVAEEARLRS
jgi:hypothetical protein